MGQRLVAAKGDVLFNAMRIDPPTVMQDNALLLGIEGDVFKDRDDLLGDGVFVAQPLDDPSLDQCLFDNLGDVGRLHVDVEDTAGVDVHYRPHRAEATTPADHHLHLVFQSPSLELGGHCLIDAG